MPNNIRLIDANVAFRFLTEQLVEERGAFSQGINKGLNIARSALRNPDAIPTFHDMPIGDPLTLDQLRGMHGRWVWIVSRDKDLSVSGWAYVGTDHVFTYWEYQPDKLAGRVVYNIGDYGEWLAFRSPTANIDRSEWVSVQERLPTRNGKYMCFYGFEIDTGRSGMMFTGCLDYYATDKEPHWQHASTGLFVTHWMPLPEPPVFYG